MDAKRLPTIYPDVLGAVTGGARVSVDTLHYAAGIFPDRVYLNQPFELFLVLQSMVDQKMQVKVEVKTPSVDVANRKVAIETPKSSMTITLGPAEVGMVRMPFVPRQPTQAGKKFVVQIKVSPSVPRNAVVIRPPDGGPPPSVLSVSPFRLQALRDVNFEAKLNNGVLKVTFDLESRALPPARLSLTSRYESMWAQEQLEKERHLAQSKVAEARRIATGPEHLSAYPALLKTVEERYAQGGMPLHPAEARAIAKMVAYTLDEAPMHVAEYSLESTHWFQRLCQVLAHDAKVVKMEREDLIVKYLFESAIYDAVVLGFSTISPHMRDLGDKYERVSYANRVMKWIAGHAPADPSYIYLPLALSGVIVDRVVQLNKVDNPWDLVDGLREAAQGRTRLLGENSVIFKTLDKLLIDAERSLLSARVPREY